MPVSVLIVDDEKMPREILLRHIPWRQLGVDTVKEADDGISALALVKTLKPSIIISDIKMSHMDGIELAKQVRETLPSCKFVFLSGYPNKEYLKDAIRLRAVSFVEKPIDLEEVTALMKVLTEECLQEMPVDPAFYFFRGNDSLWDKPLNKEVYSPDSSDIAALSDKIAAGRAAEAQKLLTHIFAELRRFEGTEPAAIRQLFRQLMLPFIDAAENRNIKEISGNRDYLLYTASGRDTLSGLEEELKKTAELYFSRISKEPEDVVAKVNLYLEQHFFESALTVQDVARNLGFVYTYLCMAYKKGCGSTVNQRLTALRISHAKELLARTPLKLYEVAAASGYSDARYFTKVFTKETGISPKKYREKHYYEA